MKLRAISKIGVMAVLLFVWMQLPGRTWAQFLPTAPLAASAIPTSQLVQPAELNKLLGAAGPHRPLILQVGSQIMFEQAHIPGSEYIGPGSRDEGLAALSNRAKSLPKDKFIVLYCGCCPWSRCPNVGNAYQTLHGLGFTSVKVLYLADNFGANWVNLGFPVAR